MEVRAEREGADGWEIEITEAHSWEIESKFVCMYVTLAPIPCLPCSEFSLLHTIY